MTGLDAVDTLPTLADGSVVAAVEFVSPGRVRVAVVGREVDIMAEAVEKVLLLPRFSSFSGTGPFYTPPMNVRAYRQAFITVWRGTGIGVVPNGGSVTLEESTDLGVWSNLGGAFNPSAGSETTGARSFALEWLRLRIDLGSASAAITMWAVGNFVRRED